MHTCVWSTAKDTGELEVKRLSRQGNAVNMKLRSHPVTNITRSPTGRSQKVPVTGCFPPRAARTAAVLNFSEKLTQDQFLAHNKAICMLESFSTGMPLFVAFVASSLKFHRLNFVVENTMQIRTFDDRTSTLPRTDNSLTLLISFYHVSADQLGNIFDILARLTSFGNI